MLLYLVQHGKAKSKEEDPDRPLTDEGRREVEAVMLLMMRSGAVTATRVVHSGKPRAAETARVIAAKIDVEPEASDGLGPMDDPEIWAERLAGEPGDVMLVGHLPHLARLAGHLACGGADAEPVAFTNGGIVCLEETQGRWSLRWAVTPSLIR